jgi:hypothetical protein
LSRYTETLSRSHEPIAAGTQKPADLLLKIDLEHKDATQVARSYEPAAGIQPFTSEYAISAHQILRAEICFIKGHPVVRLSRLKRTAAGNEKRTGSCFEFGAHRFEVVASLLSNIERELGRLANASA